MIAVAVGEKPESQGREDEELGRSQLAEQLGGVSVRRASREHAELLVNLDQRWPKLRFTRKFWEFYLSTICRGKELQFEFTVVK